MAKFDGVVTGAIELEDRGTDSIQRMIDSAYRLVDGFEWAQNQLDHFGDINELEAVRQAMENMALSAGDVASQVRDMNTEFSYLEPPELPTLPDFPEANIPLAYEEPAPYVPPVQEPVQLPIEWVSPESIEVFTGTGIERFQQEISSTNNLMEQVQQNQLRIDQLAQQTDVFPNTMLADITTLHNRISGIQSAIAKVNSNPLSDMGANAVNNQLESLRGHLDTALDLQEDLNRAMDNMDISSANIAYAKLNSLVDTTDRHIRDNITQQANFNQYLDQGNTKAKSLTNTLAGMASAYVSVQSAMAVMDLSDSISNTNARLNLIVEDGGSLEELQDSIFSVAQNARTAYLDTADTISKIGIIAGDSFSGNDELISFMDLMSKNFVIAGIDTSGQQAALLQLTQALSAGYLQGEEYNSIVENAPLLATAMEDYMYNVVGATDSMKDLSSQGLLTTEVIKNALFSAGDEINEMYESMPVTFAQAWTCIKDDIMMTMMPVIEMLAQGAWWIHQNWSTLEPVFWGLAGTVAVAASAFALYKGWVLASAVAQGILNSAIWASPYTWVVLSILLIVFVIYQWISVTLQLQGVTVSAAQFIGGTIATLFARIANLGIGLLNVLIGLGITLWNGIATLVNGTATAFTDLGAGIVHTMSGALSFVLDVVLIAARAIDTVFGSKLASGISSLQNSLTTKTLDLVGEGTVVMERLNSSDYMIDLIDYDSAWDFGASIGAGIESSVGSFDFDFNSAISDYSALADSVPAEVENIAGDTGSMADSLEISSEDLKYLRDLAETEVINRFTTAEISVSFGDVNNTVNHQTDLDGIVDYLVVGVGEALYKVAEGVH